MPITFGSVSAPSQVTINLDSIFAQSLAKYQKTLTDNIGLANAFFHEMMESEYYQSEEGGTDVRIPLMYAEAPADFYDGYDELPDTPTDGVTQSVWQWRQMASPISYSEREVIQNKEKIIDLVETKIMQSEMGTQELWSDAFFNGAGDGALATAKTSPINGASAFDPLPKLVKYDPTTSTEVGNINQSTATWWRNNTKTSTATTMTGLLQEMNNLYNTCSRRTGGAPNLIVCDQVTYELATAAIYLKWQKHDNIPDKNYPWEYTMFKKAKIVWDEQVPDVESNLKGTATYGTMYMLNTKFFRIKYIKGRDFAPLKDENGKMFQKPLKGDSRLAHIAWMGAICMSNRRKHGVMGKIARTLTAS